MYCIALFHQLPDAGQGCAYPFSSCNSCNWCNSCNYYSPTDLYSMLQLREHVIPLLYATTRSGYLMRQGRRRLPFSSPRSSPNQFASHLITMSFISFHLSNPSSVLNVALLFNHAVQTFPSLGSSVASATYSSRARYIWYGTMPTFGSAAKKLYQFKQRVVISQL